MRILIERRQSLARWVFHGRRGELRQRYHEGMEDQLGVLDLVVNWVTLRNTVYMDAALVQLREQGYPVAEADVVRLSPSARKHVEVHRRYSFALPEMPGGRRPLRPSCPRRRGRRVAMPAPFPTRPPSPSSPRSWRCWAAR
jgi:hypothetical protein